jgi:hypothetical protein
MAARERLLLPKKDSNPYNVKFLYMIKRSKTVIGCRYMDWVILVRITYDTGLGYNFVRNEKS